VEPRAGFLTAGRGRLYVRERGAGPPIVVLHGGPDFDFDYLLPELDRLAAWFRVIYYDQRGRGRSASGVRPEDVTVESEVEDLERVRRQAGLESVAVLGHSWGGVLALEYAARHPGRLTHLILLDTAPASHHDARVFRDHLRRIRPAGDAEAMQALAASDRFGAGDLDVEREYYRLHFRPTLDTPELLDRLLRRLRTNFTPERVLLARAIEERLYDQTWSAADYDVLPKVRRLAVPTLVLRGEKDFIPGEVAAHITGAIPAARLVVLPRCGHFAYLEAPAVVAEQIRDLFSAAPAARRT
jgi:proline iminopeptidase